MNTPPADVGGKIKNITTGYEPRPLQKILHNYLRRFNVLVCHRRFGKRIPITYDIPTPNGFKKFGDLVVGDQVIGRDGKACNVLDVTPITNPDKSYRIEFEDGNTIDSCREHQWYAEPSFSKLTKRKRVLWECGKVYNTEDLKKDFDSNGPLFIPLPEPTEYVEKELPIDPYVLGLWLGDGSKDTFLLTNPIEKIQEEFIKTIEENKDSVKIFRKSETYSCDRVIAQTKDSTRINSNILLKKLNLLNNKHIPEVYKLASVEQRERLVQGLMDTDGTVADQNSNVFDSNDEGLLLDLKEVLESLGCRVSRAKYLRKNKNPEYRLHFKSKFNPFKHDSRNRDLWTPRSINHSRRKIVSIEVCENVPMRCISVDGPDNLFLVTRNYIPTHNTVFAINEMIDRGLKNTKKNPQYAYIAPTYKQARKIAWKYIKEYTRNIPGVVVIKSELTVTIQRPGRICPESGELDPDEIEFMLLGADDPDSIRGMYLDGCILDEYAQCDPIIWGEVVRPALADRKGWAIFIGTPKGRNAFFDRYNKARAAEEYAKDYEMTHDIITEIADWKEFSTKYGIHKNLPQQELNVILKTLDERVVVRYEGWRKYLVSRQWYTALHRASETGILDQDEIDDMCSDLAEEEILQELECDFAAAIKGSYYGHLLNTAKADGRIGHIPINPSRPVDTFWDIGVGDKCTIWFRQKIGSNYNYVHYFEHNGEGIQFYWQILKALGQPSGVITFVEDSKKRSYPITGRGFAYGRHVWPHDGKVKEFGTGKTRQETAGEMGLKIQIQAKQSIADRIQAGRTRIQVSFFDELYCKRGLECIYNYQKEWDDKKQTFKDAPLHDWSSHGADGFGYSALDDRDSYFPNDRPLDKQKFADSDYDELAA